jgi:hypothetical protein
VHVVILNYKKVRLDVHQAGFSQAMSNAAISPVALPLRRPLHRVLLAAAVARAFFSAQDGTPFWNELFLAPLRDATGSVVHFVGVQVRRPAALVNTVCRLSSCECGK